MSDLIICPKCKRVISYNSYFQAYVCRDCGYDSSKDEKRMKYRKRPVEVEAVQWTGTNFDEIYALGYGGSRTIQTFDAPDKRLVINTLEGDMTAELGDWIIKGVIGEIYPCKPEIFAKTYEPAETSTNFDRITSSPEALAEFILSKPNAEFRSCAECICKNTCNIQLFEDNNDSSCESQVLRWLNQPACATESEGYKDV